jgi:hypothetical protein
MATLADTIKKLVEKSDIKFDEMEEFKTALEVASKVELPEDKDLLSPYILLKDAKNDPTIKNHYYAQFATQIDGAVNKSFMEIGITKDAIDEIVKLEPSSFKRIDALTAKAKEHIAKIADPGNLKGEKTELLKKLEETNLEIKTLKEVHENEKRQLVEQNENDRISHYLDREARSFKLLDIPFVDNAANLSINSSLKKHNVKIVLKDGYPSLVNALDPTLSAPDGVTIRSVIEKGFAEDKLLDLGGNKEKEDESKPKTTTSKFDTAPANSIFAANLAKAKAAMQPTQ